MTSLADWLLQQIADDEAAARAAQGPANSPMGDDAADEVLWMARNEGVAEAGIEHYSRHDPARVLAECESKRRIVERSIELANTPNMDAETCGRAFEYDDVVLRALATPYADRPGLEEAWR